MDKRQKRFRPIYARKPAKNDEEPLWGCEYGKSALSSALETAFFTLRAKKVVAKHIPKTLAPCALRFPAALYARATTAVFTRTACKQTNFSTEAKTNSRPAREKISPCDRQGDKGQAEIENRN